VWDIKSEPGIVGLFEQIWGTDKLTPSFGQHIFQFPSPECSSRTDGGNLAVPLPKAQIDNNAAPWPHSDQSPLKPDIEAIQGLLNILPNGPQDGGLMVMTGSVKYFSEVWKAFEHEMVGSPLCSFVSLRMPFMHESELHRCVSACGRLVSTRSHPSGLRQGQMARRPWM
jgi:hypothetical protein